MQCPTAPPMDGAKRPPRTRRPQTRGNTRVPPCVPQTASGPGRSARYQQPSPFPQGCAQRGDYLPRGRLGLVTTDLNKPVFADNDSALTPAASQHRKPSWGRFYFRQKCLMKNVTASVNPAEVPISQASCHSAFQLASIEYVMLQAWSRNDRDRSISDSQRRQLQDRHARQLLRAPCADSTHPAVRSRGIGCP